jgi:hypothetical protein
MAVKVFLGWSGERSRALADILYEWLPGVIQGIDPWMSKKISKGDAWFSAIGKNLNNASIGIFCLTPENIREPWVFFEAGAIYGKTHSQAAVCTLLLDLGHEDIPSPLSMFQATEFKKEDVRALLATINEALSEPISEKSLDKAFAIHWPSLEDKISKIPLPKNMKIDAILVDEAGVHYFIPQLEIFPDQTLENFLTGAVIIKFLPSLTGGQSIDVKDFINKLRLIDVGKESFFEADMHGLMSRSLRKQNTDAILIIHENRAAEFEGHAKVHIINAKFLLHNTNDAPKGRYKAKSFLEY